MTKQSFFFKYMDSKTGELCESSIEKSNNNPKIELNLKQLELKNNDKSNERRENKDDKKNEWLKSKCRITKNLIIIGFAWMFLFTV